MTILTMFTDWRRQSQLPQVAQDASTRCQQQAWELVSDRVASMRTAEIRGYVRARCAGIVNAAASDASNRENLSSHLQQKLAELITSYLIDHVTGQLALQPAVIRRAA